MNDSVKILVVDDDRDTRQLLRRALELDDHVVLEASNAQVALDVIAAEKPRLVLLDLTMPLMSGEEFMAKIKAPEYGNVKVIIVSGWDDLAKRAKDLGAAGYIKKPFSLEQLARAFRGHLD